MSEQGRPKPIVTEMLPNVIRQFRVTGASTANHAQDAVFKRVKEGDKHPDNPQVYACYPPRVLFQNDADMQTWTVIVAYKYRIGIAHEYDMGSIDNRPEKMQQQP